MREMSMSVFEGKEDIPDAHSERRLREAIYVEKCLS
jgi:hypothetical protein